MIRESLIYAFKKSTAYRANMISWFLADIALYASGFLSYFLLNKTVNNFGGYTSNEILLYISCFFLVNNLYAIFFAETASVFGEEIISGFLDYDILKPGSLILNLVIKNINFAPILSTPLLVILNLYCIKLVDTNVSVIYIISIISGMLTMGMIFLIVYSFMLFGIRSEALSPIILQLLTIGEKPDTVFPKMIKNFFIYLIPVFLFSAIPTKIALNKINNIEIIWSFLIPFLYAFILKIIINKGLKKYQSEGE